MNIVKIPIFGVEIDVPSWNKWVGSGRLEFRGPGKLDEGIHRVGVVPDATQEGNP